MLAGDGDVPARGCNFMAQSLRSGGAPSTWEPDASSAAAAPGESHWTCLEVCGEQLFVAFGADGISFSLWGGVVGGAEAGFAALFRQRFGQSLASAAQPPAGLVEALRGGSAGHLRFDLSRMTAFSQLVLQKALEIPPGEVRPYSWLAAEIGRSGACRAVGTVLARNPIPVLIPCHRVVLSSGRLGNYAGGGDLKARLLRSEGADLTWLRSCADEGFTLVASRATGVACYPSCQVARGGDASQRLGLANLGAAAALGLRPCWRCRPVDPRAQPARLAPRQALLT